MGTHATTDSAWSQLNTTDEIVAAIRAGEMVVILDDEERENEGDLVMAADEGARRRHQLHGEVRARADLPHADPRALRAAAAAVDGQQYRRSADHELHDLDRSGRRRDDGHLGARSRAHDAGRRRAGSAAARSAPARPHLSADGAARRRVDARGAHGSRLRPRAARGRSSRRRHRRDLERRRRDGAPRRSRQVRAAPRAEDRHDRRPHRVSAADRGIRRDHRRDRGRDGVRRVPARLLRGPRQSRRASRARARQARREDADARARAPAGHVERRARACMRRLCTGRCATR